MRDAVDFTFERNILDQSVIDDIEKIYSFIRGENQNIRHDDHRRSDSGAGQFQIVDFMHDSFFLDVVEFECVVVYVVDNFVGFGFEDVVEVVVFFDVEDFFVQIVFVVGPEFEHFIVRG